MSGHIGRLRVGQGCFFGIIRFLFLLSKLVGNGNQILSLFGFIAYVVCNPVDVSGLLLEIILGFDYHLILIMTLIVDHQDTAVCIGRHQTACVPQG